MIRSVVIRGVSRLSIVCVLGLLACGDAEAGRSDATVRDSAGIRIVENAATSGDTCVVSAIPALDLGVVEGPAEYQFHRVFDAATLSDGRIAVVNQGSGEIRIFSADGTFEHAFGGEGGGPGEFRRVFQLWVTAGDTLVVGDYRPWRFSIFTPEGEFVRAVVPEPLYPNVPSSMAPLANGTYLIADDDDSLPEAEGEWVERKLHVVQHGADGALLDTLAVLPHGRFGWLDIEIRFTGTPVFETTSYVAARGDRIVLGRGIERELRVYELAAAATPGAGDRSPAIDRSRPSALVRWTGPDRAVRPEDVEAYRRAERERYAEYEEPRFRRFGDASASDDRPVADRFPAHASLELGLQGDLWVRDYPRPLEEDPGWMVFDAEGRFECRAWLPFPDTWDIYEIGVDYVLGKEEDELDVEHVRRYALSRPE